MKDSEYVEFLQWCLPGLRMRWAGFRKVRRQVCKRIGRRMKELGLSDLHAYKDYINAHPAEWEILDSMCRVTVSRFHRDREAFDFIRSAVLPVIAAAAPSRGEDEIHSWSAGCASGEEAYTLQILWKLFVIHGDPASPQLRITATDTDGELLQRARRGNYTASSLKDLPEEMIRNAFDKTEGGYSLRKPFKEGITFIEQDIRRRAPEGSFHLILCRNLVFTYFEESLQAELIERIIEKLIPGGFLVIGIHEVLPPGKAGLIRPTRARCIFQKGAER